MLLSKQMRQAEEVFVLSKRKKSAPQLSAALRGGKKAQTKTLSLPGGKKETVPLVIWYRVPFPADPDTVVSGCEVGFISYRRQGPAVGLAGALNL